MRARPIGAVDSVGNVFGLPGLMALCVAAPGVAGADLHAGGASSSSAIVNRAVVPAVRGLHVVTRSRRVLRIAWSRPAGASPSAGYAVYLHGRLRARTRGRALTLTRLLGGVRYRVAVVAIDADGRRSAVAGAVARTAGCRRGGGPIARSAADTTAPAVTIGYPVAIYNDTAVFSGLTGGVAGDSRLITVRVYPGSNVSGSPMMSITTPRMSGNWYTVQSPSLAAGTYTARAEQADSAGKSATARPRRSRSRATGGGGGGPDVTAPGDLAHRAAGVLTSDATPTFAGTAGTASGDPQR